MPVFQSSIFLNEFYAKCINIASNKTLITKKFYVEHTISFNIESQSGHYLLKKYETNNILSHEFLWNLIYRFFELLITNLMSDFNDVVDMMTNQKRASHCLLLRLQKSAFWLVSAIIKAQNLWYYIHVYATT